MARPRELSHFSQLQISDMFLHIAEDPAARVDITYQTINMIPVPGLTGRLSITRNAQMRLK